MKKKQRVDNKAFRTLLGVSVSTIVEILRGEKGASSSASREMKGENLQIKHDIAENKNEVLKK